jgi:CheY-like chemotaxis protein
MVRNIAATLLAEAGYRVLTAVDGVQAVDVVNREGEAIDAILMDLTMPRMDGIEALQVLRRQGSNVPVLLSSGYTEQDVERRINGDRFDAFVQKPYTRDSLLASLAEVIARA